MLARSSASSRPARYSNGSAVAEGEAYARPARPTRSLQAPRRHDFDARAFTRALYAGSQNHAGPANVLSGASRLSGLGPSLHRLTYRTNWTFDHYDANMVQYSRQFKEHNSWRQNLSQHRPS